MLWAAEAGSFGARDAAALVFIGVAILAIWIAFRHLQTMTEPGSSKPEEPKKPPEPPGGAPG